MTILVSIDLAEAFAQPVAEDVEHQGKEHQRQPGGENRLVAEAVVRQVAEADLDDEGADGGRRLQRVDGEVRLHPGGDGDNQELSERRADSIKKYLMEKFGIAAADLVTVGYGKTKLKNPGVPTAEENRRVQVVNMASSKVAGN